MRADSFITSPSWPGEHQAFALAFHRGRLDEQHVAADARHGKAGRYAGNGGPLGCLLEELLPAERVTRQVEIDA